MEQKDSGRRGQPQAQSSAASLVREVAQGSGELVGKTGANCRKYSTGSQHLTKENSCRFL